MSQTQSELVRVCDRCDFEMDNRDLFRNLEDTGMQTDKRMEFHNNKLMAFTEAKFE